MDTSREDGFFETLELTVRQMAAQAALTMTTRIDPTPVGYRLFQVVGEALMLENPIANYPADWWQAFKKRWFPPWLERHYPVRYTTLIARHKFPHENIHPQLGKEYVDIYRTVEE